MDRKVPIEPPGSSDEITTSSKHAGEVAGNQTSGLSTEELSFLVEATRLLAASLDVETTLATVARLGLPHLGAWCFVDLVEDDHMRRLAVIHPDPRYRSMAERLISGWPPKRDDPVGVPSVVRTRRSEVIKRVTDEILVAAAGSPENLAILRGLAIGSLMTVPLLARDEVLGAITYVSPDHGDSFSEHELSLAEDLATRCAIAIDNARLLLCARQAQAQAEAANLAKMRFLSTMSHELRTPLNAIAGYAELLETGLRGTLTEAQLRDVQRIHANERHLLGLVEAVLNYARVDSGRIEFGLEDVALTSVLVHVEMIIAPLAEAKSITCEGWRQGEESDLTVYADREKLQQILTNLLANALKFSPEGGRIEISHRLAGDRVEIRVTDRGIGIAPEHLEQIFEPFVQVDEGLKKSHDGIGLGLAISRELALGMGGDLSVESEFGRGSTFTLTLARGRD
jgi:signal transduction histidine kinase